MRVHLSPRTGMIYTFPTELARKSALDGKWDAFEKSVGDMGDASTGLGYAVPTWAILGLVGTYWPALAASGKFDNKTTSEQGRLATELVEFLIQRGRLPWLGDHPKLETRREMQIRGVDITTDQHWVEVKYDELAGPEERGGSGNLFIQYAERNPHKRH